MTSSSRRRGVDRRASMSGAPTPATIFGTSLVLWLDRSLGITHGTGANVAAWADQSGSENDLSQTTDASRPTLGADGVDFDGGNDYMTAAHSASLQPSAALTIGLRIRYDTVAADQGVVQKGLLSSSAYVVQHVASGTRTWWREGVTMGRYGQSPALSASTWYSMVWVYDGTLSGNANRLKLYLGGVAQTLTYVGTISATLVSDTNPLLLGQMDTSIQRLNGQMRAVVVAHSAASQATVAALTSYLDRA